MCLRETPKAKRRESLLPALILGLSSWQVRSPEVHGSVSRASVICLSPPRCANPPRTSHSLSLVFSCCLPSVSSHPPITSDLLQIRKLAQSRISNFLKERCSLSPPYPLLVNRSDHVFSLCRSIIRVRGDRGGTQGHNSWKRFSLPAGHGRAHSLKTSPELSFTARPPAHRLQEAFSSASAAPAPPTGSPGCTEMCGHCLAPLEKHRPFRGTVQIFFKFVTPMVSAQVGVC